MARSTSSGGAGKKKRNKVQLSQKSLFGDRLGTNSISVWLEATRAETGNGAFGRLTSRQHIGIWDIQRVHLAVIFVLRG